jgi:6-phosphogluconolactonase (cycloisomerase 2 family)
MTDRRRPPGKRAGEQGNVCVQRIVHHGEAQGARRRHPCLRVDAETGNWTHVQHVGDLTDPSFVALGPDQRFLYCVHGDGEHATAFTRASETGRLGLLNRAATGGSNGLRQASDVSGRLMVVANSASGTLAVPASDEDGALRDQHQLLQPTGDPGPHRSEQTSSYPRDVVIDPSGKCAPGQCARSADQASRGKAWST